MKNKILKYKLFFILIILITFHSCKYKPILSLLPSGKNIKELGFQEIYVFGKNERNFIYEYETEIKLYDEKEIEKEAKEIFCELKKILDFKKYNYIIIKSTIEYRRKFFIFYYKESKINTFKANEDLCGQ